MNHVGSDMLARIDEARRRLQSRDEQAWSDRQRTDELLAVEHQMIGHIQVAHDLLGRAASALYKLRELESARQVLMRRDDGSG